MISHYRERRYQDIFGGAHVRRVHSLLAVKGRTQLRLAPSFMYHWRALIFENLLKCLNLSKDWRVKGNSEARETHSI